MRATTSSATSGSVRILPDGADGPQAPGPIGQNARMFAVRPNPDVAASGIQVCLQSPVLGVGSPLTSHLLQGKLVLLLRRHLAAIAP